MILGKLKIKSVYVKPVGGGSHSYKVFCACCAKQQSGPGSRSYANRELKECGWKFNRKRGGWRCGVCSKADQATIAAAAEPPPGGEPLPPAVLYLGTTAGSSPRFGIAGGALESSWQKSHEAYLERERVAGRHVPTGPPWCEVTVDLEGPVAGIVGSFGGAVWPGAWPALFTVSPQRPDGDGSTRLTDLGLELFKRARDAGNALAETWDQTRVGAREVSP